MVCSGEVGVEEEVVSAVGVYWLLCFFFFFVFIYLFIAFDHGSVQMLLITGVLALILV